VEEWMNRYTFLGTPVILNFAGKRVDLLAWAIQREIFAGGRTVLSMTDGHYSSYAELLENGWDRYTAWWTASRATAVTNCMVHCGYRQLPALAFKRNADNGRPLSSISGRNRSRPAGAARRSCLTA
jgi:hypothetical protein